MASAAAALVGQDTAADGTVAWLLYSRLLQQTTYRSDGSANVYSALCLGAANSEGIALAYSLLCEQSGITCQLVKGTLDGEPHCWNIITLGDVSWHLDVTRSDPEEPSSTGDDLMPRRVTAGPRRIIPPVAPRNPSGTPPWNEPTKKQQDFQKTVDKFLFSVIMVSAVAGVAHLVERHLAKVEVASSSLVFRSIEKTRLCQRVFFFVYAPKGGAGTTPKYAGNPGFFLP